MSNFFKAQHYAVVGASNNRAKFGNRVLQWYTAHLPAGLDVTPVNPKEPKIEGLKAVSSISQLPNPTSTSVSVITPPAVTLGVLKEALALNVHALWLQPGSEDEAVRAFVKTEGLEAKVTLGGPCILVLGQSMLEEQRGKGKL